MMHAHSQHLETITAKTLADVCHLYNKIYVNCVLQSFWWNLPEVQKYNFKVCSLVHWMGIVQLLNQFSLSEIHKVPIFRDAVVNNFGSKLLCYTGISLNPNFNYWHYSFQLSVDFLVFEEIQNCFIMHYILQTFPLKDLHFTETNHELGIAIFKDGMRKKETHWVLGHKTHQLQWQAPLPQDVRPLICWSWCSLGSLLWSQWYLFPECYLLCVCCANDCKLLMAVKS